MIEVKQGCASCEAAERDHNSGLYHADCKSCLARSIAKGMIYDEARKAGVITYRYRTLLAWAFEDDWKEGHKLVKQWDDKINGKDEK